MRDLSAAVQGWISDMNLTDGICSSLLGQFERDSNQLFSFFLWVKWSTILQFTNSTKEQKTEKVSGPKLFKRMSEALGSFVNEQTEAVVLKPVALVKQVQVQAKGFEKLSRAAPLGIGDDKQNIVLK